MPQVTIELFFPLSRAVKKNATGQISLTEDITLDESLRSLFIRLAQRYRELQNIFDVNRQEINPIVWVTVNNIMLTSPEFLDTKLKEGDTIGLLPEYAGG